jgi:hypothetical protein
MKIRTRGAAAVVFAAALVGFAGGCGGQSTVSVEGKVTVDGKPLDVGTIGFHPDGWEGKTVGNTVLNGEYKVPEKLGLAPGKYKVQVHWLKPTGKKSKSETGEELDVREEGLPEKYHEKTELKADLTTGPNKVDFDLKP